jgi:hypothetical protein
MYNLNTQLLYKNHFFFFRSLQQNEKAITLTLRDAMQTMVNGDADKIRSPNFETVLKLRIFFLIATVPGIYLTTVNILTHLISLYQYQL